MQQVQTMQINGEELEKRIANIEKDLSKVLDLLSGNSIDKKDNGVVGSVNDHEDRLITVEKKIDRFFWTLIGMGLPAGIGVFKILEKIFESFKH